VSPAHWGDFWLNEGFTMYAQRRITAAVDGEAITALETRTGQALLGLELAEMEADSPLRRMRIDLSSGLSPEDVYSECPYEGGFQFVSYLASLAGSPEAFHAWLTTYCNDFAFKSIPAEEMWAHFTAAFPAVLEGDGPSIPFHTWLSSPEWPKFVPSLEAANTLSEPAEATAAALIGATDAGAATAACQAVDVNAWPTYQKLHMLDTVLAHGKLKSDVVCAADAVWGFSASSNAEIQLRWCQIIAKSDAVPLFPAITAFLTSQGKQKYTLPVHRALAQGSNAARMVGLNIFADTKAQLHQLVANYVAKIWASTPLSA
jgi:aminopeptidase B